MLRMGQQKNRPRSRDQAATFRIETFAFTTARIARSSRVTGWQGQRGSARPAATSSHGHRGSNDLLWMKMPRRSCDLSLDKAMPDFIPADILQTGLSRGWRSDRKKRRFCRRDRTRPGNGPRNSWVRLCRGPVANQSRGEVWPFPSVPEKACRILPREVSGRWPSRAWSRAPNRLGAETWCRARIPSITPG